VADWEVGQGLTGHCSIAHHQGMIGCFFCILSEDSLPVIIYYLLTLEQSVLDTTARFDQTA